MPSYFDQIAKQLAARRKALKAVESNPALLPSCWGILRQITNLAFEYMRTVTTNGCIFPDRPMFLSVSDAAFINFGTNPDILRLDIAWIASEEAGATPPAPDSPPPALSSEAETRLSSRLADAAHSFGLNHRITHVYNIESWLQEMYRDCLDVDYGAQLQRQIDNLNVYMESVPKALNATGLVDPLSKEVMDAFNLFKNITGSSHQLEHEKMSFSDKRTYVDTLQLIENALQKADAALGAASSGYSAVRELFGFWKNANYEMMNYSRQFRALWSGTSLDDRILDLTKMLGAIQATLGRCSEQDAKPQPQFPILAGDDDSPFISHAQVVETFQAVTQYDLIIGQDSTISRSELRRYGPLSVIIAPGQGTPRFCSEIRHLDDDSEDDKGKDKSRRNQEREMEVDRRAIYPLNYLVVPSRTQGDKLAVNLVDAWLEYNQQAYPTNFKGTLDEVKLAAPASFTPPPDLMAKDMSPHFARQVFAKLIAAFVAWSKDGSEPSLEDIPEFANFRTWALKRLSPPSFIVPLRYRSILDLFREASRKRRDAIWKRYLGPRYMLDRQLVAVNILQKDWTVLRDNLKYLPPDFVRSNSNITAAFSRLQDTGDPMREHKAANFFRRFLADDPDLKTALLTVESAIAIEMETLRSQSESLGRTFQYDQVSQAMMRRQASQIQEKRNIANSHIDQYLTGLMYVIDGNHQAAVVAMSMCLAPLDKRETDIPAPLEIPNQIDATWFEQNMKPKEQPFEKKNVPGENGLGTVCFDFIYFNLGQVYMLMKRYLEAAMSFRGYIEGADPKQEFLPISWAEELASNTKELLKDTTPAP